MLPAHLSTAARHPGARRLCVTALALLAMACGGDTRAAPPAQSSADGDVPEAAAPAGETRAEPQPAPMSPADSLLAEQHDSIHEAELYQQRQQSMETYESCMAKARGLEPPVRATIEAACKRSPGAPH